MARGLRVLLTPLPSSRGRGQVVGGSLALASLGVGSSSAKVEPVPAKIKFNATCFAEARNPGPKELELGALVGEVTVSPPDFLPELLVSVADSQALLQPAESAPDAKRPRRLRLALQAPSVVMPPGGPPFVELRIPGEFLEGARHLEVRAAIEVGGSVEGDLGTNDVLDVPLIPEPLFKLKLVDEMGEPLTGVPVDFVAGDELVSAVTPDEGPLVFDDLGFPEPAIQLTDHASIKTALKQRWAEIRPGRVLKDDPDAGIEARFVSTCLEPVSLGTAPIKTLAIVPRVTLVRLLGLLFDSNKSFLLPSALSDLDALRQVADDHPNGELLVVGHTDTSADPATNDPLSLERAESVLAFLKEEVQYAIMQTRLRGPTELLPSNSYPDPFFHLGAGITNKFVDVYQEYGKQEPPGMIPPTGESEGTLVKNTVTADDVTSLRNRIREASDFTASVAGVFHPKTFVLFGDGFVTDVEFDFRKGDDNLNGTGKDPRVGQLPQGDGTVPRASARCEGATGALGRNSAAVRHAECFGEETFRVSVIDRIRRLLALGP